MKINSALKILFFSLFAFLFSLFTFTPSVFAQGVTSTPETVVTIPITPAPWFQQDIIESSWQIKEGMENPEDVHKFLYDTSTLNNMINSLNLTLGGICTDETCSQTKGVAIRQLASILGSVYAHPPASGLAWLSQTIQDFGLAPKVYAQGIGFAGLTPLLPLWRIFRNIAYAFIVLVMVVIGLMIMFRAKIDPKTVISVQQAIPKIIIAILLITFSYPIAGFLVDLMYIILMAALTLLVPVLKQLNIHLPQDWYLTGGLNQMWGLMWGFFPDSAEGGGSIGFGVFVGALIAATIAGPIIGIFAGPLGVIIPALLGILVGGGITMLSGGSLGASILSPIIFLLFLLTVVFLYIRILFLLINCYIQILLSIIFAPLLLLSEAIPGQSSFSNWIRNLFANLMVFPTAVLIMILAQIINLQLTTQKATLWTPPLLGSSIPVVGGINNIVVLLVSVGFFAMIPTLAGAVKDFFKAKPALHIGAGGAIAPFWSGFQTATEVMHQFYYMKTLFPGKSKGGGESHT